MNFCEIVWPKNVGSFLGKCQRGSPFLIKLHDNVSKIGLRDKLSPRIFPILEQPFCRAHASISSWSLDTFLDFNREALLFSLLELATHKSTKGHLLRKVPEKGFIGNVPFQKSYMAAACNFTLRSFSRLWPFLLAYLCDWINILFYNWSVAGAGFSDSLTNRSK